MNIRKIAIQSALIIALGTCCLLPFSRARAQGEATVPVPAIIVKGFGLWAKNREASWAFDTWQAGGLLERDAKPATLSRYFARHDINLGPYKSFEVMDTKRLSQNSFVLYICINFDKAAMFGRFMMYRTERDWVVQNMDFSPNPEAVVPGLTFEGETYTR
jgi:hypothetical protein